MNAVNQDKQKTLLPIVAAIAFFMASLDTTSVNTIIPYLSTIFHSPLATTKNIIIFYMIANSLFIPLTGVLCQKYSCRTIFCIALFIFTLGSLLCGISNTMNELLAARIIQGMGGALMLPVGRLAVIQTFPKDQLIKALSMVTIPGLMGPLIGPIVGGIIASYLNWSVIFFINIPFGIAGIYFALKHFPTQNDKNVRIDIWGYFIFAAGIALVTYALSLYSETTAYTLPTIIFCVGLVLLGAYWIRSLYHDYPLFSPKLFKIKSFSIGILGNLVARLGCGAVPFMIPLMLQRLLGLSPVACGVAMLPLAISAMVAKPFVSKSIKLMGYRNFLFINTLALSASYVSYCLINEHSGWVLISVLMFITGFVNSMQFTAMNTVTVLDLSPKRQPAGSCLLSTVMQVSMASGVAISAILLTLDETVHLHALPATHFHFTWLYLGIITVISAFIFVLLPNKRI
ncbi:MFS family (AraJ) (PDB:4LDS) [Commensalibacter communis]|uniref:MFS family (AraJ) n=1 Tax=Commensalibacter communis TaxID=2972786 RepID=A0A9W4XCV0_9PROT|nr:DHA2 family efflux MFS transporter permease subunit [Commensalibacter communis]CAI3925903.1 MFS family (AraJ) (PDB:4LDS) [Commensalibacter communis]CAI3926452.1 MFS family (AraJ) (PDB:4LDS) [Commensalibacter communis]CAI3934920.1 MFS family (AraJ) (PDB:4LDS) [Commensalibacter communis]CAI3936535.1 MFS family (AraJ) (PDB:4LDS) [Commensalibacter communis]